jgi:hypothetical protein
LPDSESEIFLREGLDDPNHVEITGQIKFCAQRIFRANWTRPRPRYGLCLF